jgi:fatty acid desaturase
VVKEATTSDLSESERSAGTSPEYEDARKRVERKRKFRGDVVAYVVVNAFLIGVWAVSGFGYFWPGWVLAGWGVFVLLDAWNVYYRRPVTEDDIQHELRQGH